MKAKITKRLISEIQPQDKSFEIIDTELPGFLVRVLPSRTITYMVSYRWKAKKNRVTIGRHPILSALQARDEAKKILAGLALGNDPAERTRAKKAQAAVHTLKTFIDDEYKTWLEAHRKDGKASIKRIKSVFKDLLETSLIDIDIKGVERWRTSRITDGIQNSTINRDLNALKSLLSTAESWNVISQNVLLGFAQLEIDKTPVTRYLSVDEEKRLTAAIIDRELEMIAGRARNNEWRKARGYFLFPPVADPLKSMYYVSIHTGIRWGSLVALEWKDIDWHNEVLTARGATGKSGDTYHVALNRIALETLKEWQSLNNKSEGLIFPSTKGSKEPGGKTRDNVNKAWATVKAKARIINFRWHDLRHTFASKLVMASVDLNTVRELLGHKDIKMTLRYAHLAPEHKAAAVAALL